MNQQIANEEETREEVEKPDDDNDLPMEKKDEPMEEEEEMVHEECRIPVNGQPIVFEPSDALKNLYQDNPSTKVRFS